MDRRAFLRRSTAVAAGLVAADQLDVIERIGWTRRLFSGFGGGTPTLYGDGVHDDTLALQAIIDGKRVRDPNRRHRTTEGRVHIGNGFYRLTDTIRLGGRH